MRVKYLFLNVLCSFLISFPAIASDWVNIATTKDFTMYVDNESIKGDPSDRKFWVKNLLTKKQIDTVSEKYYIRTKEYWGIDCNNDVFTIYEVDYYSDDGKLVNGYSYPGQMRVIPETVGDVLHKYVCGFKPTK